MVCDAQGTEVMYAAASRAVADIRCCAAPSAAWKEDIEQDFAARG